METRNTATRKRSNRSGLDYAQPVLRLTPQPGSKREHAQQVRMLSMSDAEIAVRWLNASAGKASHNRIVEILGMLRQFESVRTEMNRANADYAKLQFVQRAPDQEVTAAAKEYEQRVLEANEVHVRINEALAHYVFRPRVTYTVIDDAWRGGMVPDDNRRWFQIKLADYCTISEADAAMSLVRLHLTGDLAKVRLCEMCSQQWCVASKRNYRFCSRECREKFYTQAPEYSQRKAETQKKYRRRLKLKLAAEDAKRKGGR